jgi:hypothetical protein
MSARAITCALATSALLATLWLVPATVALGGEAPRLGLTPMGQTGPYFDLTLAPGEHRQLEVEAANFGRERTRARTYTADVYSIVNGGFGAELYGDGATGTTTWLSYPTQQIMLEPQEALLVAFVVGVPANTPPGEYITALVIESTEPLQGTGPLALKQVNRSAIAVAIDVPGPREPGIVIGLVGHKAVSGHSILTFEVDNPGNVHLWPAGDMVLRDAGGSRIMAEAVVMDALYAGTATLLEAPVSDALPPGEYCAELSLTDPATGAHDATDCLTFFVGRPQSNEGAGGGPDTPWSLPGTSVLLRVTPLSLSILVGAALIGSALLLAVRRRGSRQKAAHRPNGQLAKPATVSHRVHR